MAEAELQDAAAWYDERTPGLGLRFVRAVRSKADQIIESPHSGQLAAGSRRILMGRFPYALVYREISDEEIEIVALAHLRRRSGYWAAR
jgi:plasmid stabilization system protein ParE